MFCLRQDFFLKAKKNLLYLFYLFFLIFTKLENTACFANLDQCSLMGNIKTILTTFKMSVIFIGRWNGSKNWLDLEIKLACLN
jgi:hypothetical protein